MKKIRFTLAGKHSLYSPVFLQSKNRTANLQHRNDNELILKIPADIFKKYFTYEHSTGIYRTELKYFEIQNFCNKESLYLPPAGNCETKEKNKYTLNSDIPAFSPNFIGGHIAEAIKYFQNLDFLPKTGLLKINTKKEN